MNAVREARNELLASEDKALRRCYDYLQDARECMYTLNDEAAYHAYKAIEVLEVRFGGERQAVAALGNILKKAKTAANQKRHIPEKGHLQPKASVGSVELTRQVIRKYERYLLDHPCVMVALRLQREQGIRHKTIGNVSARGVLLVVVARESPLRRVGSLWIWFVMGFPAQYGL